MSDYGPRHATDDNRRGWPNGQGAVQVAAIGGTAVAPASVSSPKHPVPLLHSS